MKMVLTTMTASRGRLTGAASKFRRYPVDGKAWNSYEHFLAHCDWIHLELLPGTGAGAAAVGATGATVLGSVSVVLSLGAVVAAAYAGCLLRRHHGFEGIARLT